MYWINADDYGFNKQATFGILEAFKQGWIHTTTACSNGYYFDEAVKIAYENDLVDKIGLHLNITEGYALTDEMKKNPFFCNGNGEFHGNLNRYKPISKENKRILECELQAQFDKFMSSGIEIHHVDSHHHIHTAPCFASTFIRVAKKNHIKRIRKTRNININNPIKSIVKGGFNLYLKCRGIINSDKMGSLRDYIESAHQSKWYDYDEVMVHPTYSADGRLVDNHSETYDPDGPLLLEEINELLHCNVHKKIPNLIYLSNAPAPYRVKFWNELGNHVPLIVLFELCHSKERTKEWTGNAAGNYKQVILPAIFERVNDAMCPNVVRYWSKKSINILSGYNTPTSMLSIMYMNLLHIPYVISVDGAMIKDEPKIVAFVKKKMLSGAKYWLSTGQSADQYLCHYGALKEKIFRYPFTSVSDSYVLKAVPSFEEKKTIREELGIRRDRVIISVGRFIKSKAFDVLLDACNLISREIEVIIIGGIPTEEYLELQKKYGLDNVHFINHISQDKLKLYYQSADCFVLPTLTDAWGLVINEAMANGLPVVTTDHCIAGVEMIVEGENGYIVGINDANALAERMIEIIDNDDLRINMANNALLTAQKYTIEQMVESHMDFLRMICNGI